MQWLLIDVSKLSARPGLSRTLTDSGPVEGFLAGLGRVDESDPVHVDLTLTNTGEAIAASGRVEGSFALNCCRCLVEYRQDFWLDLDESFYFDPQAAESRDGYEVQDQMIDLEPMLRDAIVLSIPVTPVHAGDCKGLCPVCGSDLNVSDCGHARAPVDIRWAPLKIFLEEKQ